MTKKLFILTFCFMIVALTMLFVVNENNAAYRSVVRNLPTAKKEMARVEVKSSLSKVPTPTQYRPATRQPLVLFVEDPGQTGFGPATKPDPQWTSWLEQTLGAGNYGWWGPIVDSSDGPPVDTMNLYNLVIWNCYDWWWGPPCYAPSAQALTNMSTYMDGGGKVWFIGQDANWATGGLLWWLGPYFEVQSITDDALWDIWSINLQGEGVLTGFAWSDSSDYQANGFFSDNVTPTANGQQIVTDGGSHFCVLNNDFSASFWTIDGGRIVSPEPTWVAVVDSMLKLFGIGAESHNVGVVSVLSPIDSLAPGDHSVIGQVQNLGSVEETFDVTAEVYDTTAGWTQIFDSTITLTTFPAGGDTNLDFGLVTLGPNAVFSTVIYSLLGGDEDPSNDTAFAYCWTPVTDVEERPKKENSFFSLSQNVPNPYTVGFTSIAYSTTKKCPVSLNIFDSSGRSIKTLVDRIEVAGQKTVQWDGKDSNSRPVSAGIYFYRLTAEKKTASKKMIVVR